MPYNVIFLDGKNKLPYEKCEVCEKLERNVKEPVVLFIDVKEDISNLTEDRIEELKKENRKLNNGELRCIFHCEKENKIWIENFEEYKEYRERLEKAIENGEEFNEENPAKWNEKLVKAFWERIRAYRFAVDYYDGVPNELKHIAEEHKDLLEFYFNELKKLEPDEYNFKNFIFPEFENLSDDIIEIKKINKNNMLFFKYNTNFWFKGEEYSFKKNVNFEQAQFHWEAYFWEAQFHGEAYLREAKFQGYVYFWGAQFHGEAYFGEAQFHGEAYFGEAQFHGEANFREAQFHGEAYFREAQFHGEASFWGAQFHGEANFREAQFHGEVDFREAQFHGEASFGGVQFQGEAYLGEAQFHGEASFGGVQFQGEAYLGEAQFHGEAYFWGAQFHGEAYFWGAQFHGEVDFREAKFHGEASFGGVQFHGEAYFGGAQFHGEAYFGGAQFHGKASFGEVQFQGETNFWEADFYSKADFSRCRIEKKLFISMKKESKATLFDLSNLVLNPDAHIEIRNLTTKNLKINELSNFAKEFIFFDLKLIENNDFLSFEIKNSILNKMRFINCDFSEGRIEIEDSSLTDCEFVNVDWGKFDKKRLCPELFFGNKNVKPRPDKARDIYRQLKHAHDKQRDYINANGFYSLEMKAREKSLELKLKEGIWGERFLFNFFKWVSDFGQSWIKPVVILFYTIFIIALLQSLFDFKNTSAGDFFSLSLIVPITDYYFIVSVFLLFVIILPLSFVFESLSVLRISFALFFLSLVGFEFLNTGKGFSHFLYWLAESLRFYRVDNVAIDPWAKIIVILCKLFILFLLYQIGLAVRRKIRR